jgi:uncharacterized protein involved in exopolysaccharide biosynthesis
MEEEIDLRAYVAVLIRHWYWIAGLALAAAVVAFGVSSLLSPTYEATAMVIITQPRYVFQFDARMQNVPFDPNQLSNGYPAMATSDDLLLSVANSMDPPLPPEQQSPVKLREMLRAETAGSPTLITLTAQSDDAEEAASLANTWAAQYVEYLDEVYDGNNDVPLFEAQVAEASTALAAADQALTSVRSQYGLGFAGFASEEGGKEMGLVLGIARRLQAKTDLLTEYQIRADRLVQLLAEARAAAAQAEGTTSPAILAGVLGDMLRLGLMDGETALPVQINLGGLDARDSLSAVVTALEAKQEATGESIARLTGEVEALQSELAARQQEVDQLLRDRQVAQITYLTLSSKLQEARIKAQDETETTARLASRASAPEEPVSPRRLLNTVVAGALGVIVGVFGAFFLEYWRQGEAAEAASAGELAPERVSIG